ncbi:MAG TPA: glycosyltransferase family 9 protein [Acetobacteraceae bacterium]|nr:glycosyltransferase family 9 protein [Acetobacteraceae bacterium]
MRVLFVTSRWIGDAVLATILLDHVIRTHPDARITVACGPAVAGVFARMPNCERMIIYRRRHWNLHSLLLWARCVGKRWDLVLDTKRTILGHTLLARRRAVRRLQPGRHLISALAAMLDLDPSSCFPVAWTAPEDEARAAALLPADRPVVILGPTANSPGKMWPVERFAELFRALAAGPLPGAVPVILAGPGERERTMSRPLLEALPGAIDLVGRLSLPEVAACLARATIYVGNDSGLMHFAAATGAPTLGLFGPTPLEKGTPIGRRTAAAVASGNRMEDLPVADALAAAERLLSPEA